MSKTFAAGKDDIAKICKYFLANRDSFLAQGMKEAHVRQTLIDPLFEALGWDVRNIGMTAPQYREVIPEDSLDIEGHQKAPDYTFRVGSQAKFYAEAKKCGVNISGDPGPAYQLRRYGWSAKVVLSILTDFDELGVYDCSARPVVGDKASNSRLSYFRAEEYPDRWKEIWDIFSREAVWSGQFDQFAASKRKRGTSEVDAEFLKEIECWRDELARNIALRNPRLSLDDLNSAVQLTIDRIVFLRMAEDRGIEPYERLLKLVGQPDIYSRFIADLCRKADEKYNSGLFHFQKEDGIVEAPDKITPSLNIDDKILKPILRSLYFEYGSPYHFGVMPVEILGTVYERFLGKVIRLTEGHQAKIEDKPEVRKAGGVYYTPRYIVDYIVKNTVGKKIESQSPAQLAGGKSRPPFRVLDMACGSGSFLLGAYQCLLDHCLNWYMANKPETQKKSIFKDVRTGQWRLTIDEKKRILTTHIFGVDIDPQAVEVSKLSLLLKVLEGETDQTFSQNALQFADRVLPNLASNIKCGNSLIGPDYFSGKLIPDPEELKRVNPFSWEQEFPEAMKAGGFDCVIGNPPYVRQESLSGQKEYLWGNFQSFNSAADLYVYFMERGVRLLRNMGRFGFIVSSSFLRASYAEPLRRVLKSLCSVVSVLDFGGLAVFENAKDTYVCIPLLLKGGQAQTVNIIRAPALSLHDVEEYASKNSFKIPESRLGPEAWALYSDDEAAVLTKLQKVGQKLGEYVDGKMFYSIKTGLNEAFEVSEEQKHLLLKGNRDAATLIKLFLGGQNIRRYGAKDERLYLIVIPAGWTRNKMIGGDYKRADISERSAWSYFQDNYPTIGKHLEKYRDALGKRQDKGDYWWELRPCDYYDYFEKAKIVFPDISKEPRFYLDREGIYLSNTAYLLGVDDAYLLGILNSRLFWFMISHISIPFGVRAGEYRYRLIYQYMEKVPIRRIDFSRVEDRAHHDHLASLVDTMLTLHKQIAKAESVARKEIIQRQIDSTDKEIDQLVYELYGLTNEEIKVVEGEGT